MQPFYIPLAKAYKMTFQNRRDNPCPAQSRLEFLSHYLTQILGPPSRFAHHCLKNTVLKACSRDCSSWDICCGCCCLVTQFVTPGTVARRAPLSMEFPRQGHYSHLPFPSPGDLLNPGIKPVCPALACGFFTTEPPGKPQYLLVTRNFISLLLLTSWANKISKCCVYACLYMQTHKYKAVDNNYIHTLCNTMHNAICVCG